MLVPRRFSPTWRTRSRHVAGATLLCVAGLAGTSAAGTTAPSFSYVPLAPCRLADTRPGSDNVGVAAKPIGAGGTLTVAGRGHVGNCDIPAEAVSLQLNITVTNGTAPSFLTVYPADIARPLAASLNWVAQQPPTPNSVTATLAADGRLSLFNYAGTVDVVVDVAGYYVPAGAGQGGPGATGPAGPAGPKGDRGEPGPAGARNRLTDAQIGALRWDLDPGRAHIGPTAGPVTATAFDGAHLWLGGDGTVTEIDRVSLGTLRTVPVTGTAHHVAFDGRYVWASTDGDTVYRIDPATGTTDTVSGFRGAGALVSDGVRMWVAETSVGAVRPIDAQLTAGTPVTLPGAAARPTDLVFDGRRVWILDQGGLAVVPLDGGVLGAPIPLTGAVMPFAMVYDGISLWIGDDGALLSLVPDIAEQPQALPLASGTVTSLAYDGLNIWVGSDDGGGSGAVDVVVGPSHTVVAHIDLPAPISSLTYDGTNVWAGVPGSGAGDLLAKLPAWR